MTRLCGDEHAVVTQTRTPSSRLAGRPIRAIVVVSEKGPCGSTTGIRTRTRFAIVYRRADSLPAITRHASTLRNAPRQNPRNTHLSPFHVGHHLCGYHLFSRYAVRAAESRLGPRPTMDRSGFYQRSVLCFPALP